MASINKNVEKAEGKWIRRDFRRGFKLEFLLRLDLLIKYSIASRGGSLIIQKFNDFGGFEILKRFN